MKNKFTSSFKRKKEKIFGVLDVGSESAKFLVVKKEGKKITILGKGLKDYEMFGVFNGRDFELDVMKKAIKEALREAQKEADIEIEDLIVGFPAHIFKTRISCQKFERSQPRKIIGREERERIFKTILEMAKKEVAEGFTRETGILPEELHFLSEKILQIKIDGYKVLEISGFSGKEFECKTLITFLPKYYLENSKKLIEKTCGLKILKILHESEGMVHFLSKDQSVLLLDIGADFTQVFLAKKGNLEMVSEFRRGGKNFSLALCKNFGILYNKAKEFSIRYQKGFLEEKTRAHLRELFLREAQNWFLDLEEKVKDKVFFENILYFGGGANFTEIDEVLEKNWGLSVKALELKDMPNIEDETKKKDNLQFIPAILLTYAI